jgi:hypothetical protein
MADLVLQHNYYGSHIATKMILQILTIIKLKAREVSTCLEIFGERNRSLNR